MEFTCTLTPTNTGFRIIDDPDGRFLRLWVGETHVGQKMALLSYSFYCPEETGFIGFDYTPVDIPSLEALPEGQKDRLHAISRMMSEFTTDSNQQG